MHRDPTVDLILSLDEAESLHALLEDLLEKEEVDQRLERIYRHLGWRILATRGCTGLTGRIAGLVRDLSDQEKLEYEEARDRELGPVLDGLESAENRDP